MGIRSWIITLVGGVAAAVVLGMSFITLATFRSTLVKGVEMRGRIMLEALSFPCAKAIAEGDPALIDNLIEELVRRQRENNSDLLHVAVADSEGRLITQTWPPSLHGEQRDLPEGPDLPGPGEAPREERGGSVETSFEQMSKEVIDLLSRKKSAWGVVTHGDFIHVALAVESGLHWGWLVATFSMEQANRREAEVKLRTLLGAVGMLLVISLILYLAMSALVVKPVSSLVEGVERLAEGELATKVRVEGGREFVRLGQAFNQMSARLEIQTRDLEESVRERTQELFEANKKLKKALAHSARLARTDGLTGLYNRQYLDEILTLELQRCERMGHHTSVLMIDVDKFKTYNDTHGHPAGDDILRGLASLMVEALRKIDVVARYGGEEFTVLLLETSGENALIVAERLRVAFEAREFPGEEKQPGGRLTISIGVASYPTDAREPASLVSCADQALYKAKEAGRNRVVRYIKPA